MPDKNTDFLGMSDDDFLDINEPTNQEPASQGEPSEQGASPAASAEPAVEEPVTEPAAETTAEPAAEPAEEPVTDPIAEEPAAEPEKKIEEASDDEVLSAKAPETEEPAAVADPAADAAAEAKPGEPAADPAEKPAGDAKDKPADGEKPAEAQVNYEDFYQQVMKPFKANGREIQLKSPDEAIRLMQMGAGYGRKIQDLQPHLKVIRMLEKNDLLDEGRLSYLMDINDKNPDAIKKLIKESGIDPLDINTEDNVDYRPTDRSVSDKEMSFQDALTDVSSQPTGQETIQIVNQTWDQESKSLLWDQPEILSVIQSQRENGIYDQIASEIDRQKMLGQIPQSTPFLTAYKLAGDHLVETNGFKSPEGQAPQNQEQTPAPAASPQIQEQPPQKQVIATRPGAAKATVSNNEQAQAASPTKSASGKGKAAPVNPLSMPDDEFLKTFDNRL